MEKNSKDAPETIVTTDNNFIDAYQSYKNLPTFKTFVTNSDFGDMS